MALSVALSSVTASDGTFSASGATAWLTVTGRTATLSGVASAAQGGTGIAYFTAAGPTVARTYTFPDADAAIARTDAANTFTGIQTFSTPIATASVATMSATVGGGVPTPPNNTTTFLRGDGTFATPAAAATLNGVTAATGAVTIASGNNTGIVWNWANTTNTTVCHTFGETTAATNGTSSSGIPNQVLFKLTTAAASTQSPLSVYQRGTHVFSVDPTNPQILANSGTAANPSYSFAGATTSGMIFAASELQFIYAGAQAFSCYKTGTLGQLLASDRAASFPSPHFSNDGGTPDTGFNLNANVIGVAVSGIENSRFVAGAFQPSKGSGDAVSYAVNFRKARGTVASPTVITTGDDLATINGLAYVGATNTYRTATTIRFDSTGTISDATTGVGGEIFLASMKQAVDTAAVDRWKLDQVGHTLAIAGTANTPTITAGGGTGPTIAGNDTNCTITVGTGGIAQSVTVTFGSAYPVAPRCSANHQGAILVLRCVSTTTTCVIDAATPFTASGLIDLIVSGGTA